MEKNEKQLPDSPIYVRHFGVLSHQATINSISAYLDDGPDKQIALAWLLKDTSYLNQAMEGNSPAERHQRINGALTSVAKDLWKRDEMEPYQHERVVIELPRDNQQGTA
ncbi:MAG: hypothetical protein JWN75_943 [Candidatus Saccharibacteria bacterium]|nr:hypothetical protein [Candidatus Saccharibacteria bacterium]